MALDAHLVDVISNDLKQALEEPIIFITQTDYIEHIFNSLSALKDALATGCDPDYTYFMELITKHHTDWLVAVAEINAVAKNLHSDLRDAVSYSITYTINCARNKPKLLLYFLKSKLVKQELRLVKPHIKTIESVSRNMESALKDKRRYFKQCTDDEELAKVMREETDHLLDWLDSMYSKSIISLCKVLEIWCQDLGTKLHKALVITSQRIADSLDTSLSYNNLLAINSDLLILEQKIKDLHNNLSKSKSDTPTTLALVDLKADLESQLKLIESTNKSHMSLKSSVLTIISGNINTLNKMMPVFEHQLPSKLRERLVGQMIKVWKIVFGKRADADLKMSFVSKKNSQITKGLTFVDKDDNVYYYDNEGRYSMDKDIEKDLLEDSKDRVRVLGDDVFKRLKETCDDGIEYRYDDIGRYYEDNVGKKIYKDIDSDTEYEPDEFGNLIRLRDSPEKYFYAGEGSTAANIEDSEYLKHSVGNVLKKCLTKVVMYQPTDPIKYLASLLIKHAKLEKERVDNIESDEELKLERSEYRFKL